MTWNNCNACCISLGKHPYSKKASSLQINIHPLDHNFKQASPSNNHHSSSVTFLTLQLPEVINM